MAPAFDYEKSDKRGVRVSRRGEDRPVYTFDGDIEVPSTLRTDENQTFFDWNEEAAVEDRASVVTGGAVQSEGGFIGDGSRLRNLRPNKLMDGATEIRTQNGSILIEVDDTLQGKIEDGTLEWYGKTRFHDDIQVLGNRHEIEQVSVSTEKNLIELNKGLEEEQAPYSGIEIHRGNDPSAFLIYPEDTRRWTAVKEGERETFAVLSDSLSSFEQDLTTDDISEGERKYMRPTTSSHNFWVSNEVKVTKGSGREILPAFISAADHERKRATRIRTKLATGSASIQLLVNGEPATGEIAASDQAADVDVRLEDGDALGVDVLETSSARNLSVSVTIQTTYR